MHPDRPTPTDVGAPYHVAMSDLRADLSGEALAAIAASLMRRPYSGFRPDEVCCGTPGTPLCRYHSGFEDGLQALVSAAQPD